MSLETRGKTHLESYIKLKKSFQQMKMKRDNLAKASTIESNKQQQIIK